MACADFSELFEHIGHTIVCVTYGIDEPIDVSIECQTCGCVIDDFEPSSPFFKEMLSHVGHKLECELIESETMGNSVAIRCIDCQEDMVTFYQGGDCFEEIPADTFVCGNCEAAFIIVNDNEDDFENVPCFCPYCGIGDSDTPLIPEEYEDEDDIDF